MLDSEVKHESILANLSLHRMENHTLNTDAKHNTFRELGLDPNTRNGDHNGAVAEVDTVVFLVCLGFSTWTSLQNGVSQMVVGAMLEVAAPSTPRCRRCALTW